MSIKSGNGKGFLQCFVPPFWYLSGHKCHWLRCWLFNTTMIKICLGISNLLHSILSLAVIWLLITRISLVKTRCIVHLYKFSFISTYRHFWIKKRHSNTFKAQHIMTHILNSPSQNNYKNSGKKNRPQRLNFIEKSFTTPLKFIVNNLHKFDLHGIELWCVTRKKTL